ncbi:hypothetical protein BV20DRAFT_1123631 [Pilatotrama ljubarskyi]|nr:hypothetical protein BV20DRAFT_1123631 [Pilatotrama ljubarskyi]
MTLTTEPHQRCELHLQHPVIQALSLICRDQSVLLRGVPAHKRAAYCTRDGIHPHQLPSAMDRLESLCLPPGAVVIPPRRLAGGVPGFPWPKFVVIEHLHTHGIILLEREQQSINGYPRSSELHRAQDVLVPGTIVVVPGGRSYLKLIPEGWSEIVLPPMRATVSGLLQPGDRLATTAAISAVEGDVIAAPAPATQYWHSYHQILPQVDYAQMRGIQRSRSDIVVSYAAAPLLDLDRSVDDPNSPAFPQEADIDGKLSICFRFRGAQYPNEKFYTKQFSARHRSKTMNRPLTRLEMARLIAQLLQEHLDTVPVEHNGEIVDISQLVLMEAHLRSKKAFQPVIGILRNN